MNRRRLPRFQLDPQQAAQEAMKLYDKNADGMLDANELRASPPLWDLLQNLKAQSPDHPDTLTAADIAGRLEEWVKSPATILPAMAVVYLDGKPLPKATVTFEPEPFLGPSYHSHQGTTTVGAGIAQLDPELKAAGNGVYVGLYRVRISKKVDGKETLPRATTRKRNSAWNSPPASAMPPRTPPSDSRASSLTLRLQPADSRIERPPGKP